MKAISETTATARALSLGVTEWQLQSDSLRYVTQVGRASFNSMITALSLHSWNNSADEWQRLAAALRARRIARSMKGKNHVKRESVI